MGEAYEYREDGVSAVLVVSEKGLSVLSSLQKENRIIEDKTWNANICLAFQSTEDYPDIELRDKVIERLAKGKSLQDVQQFYFKRLPLNKRLRSFFKRTATLLPNSVLIKIRRLARS